MTETDKISILLIDDKEVFREGLARILDEQGDIEVVYQCSSLGSLDRIQVTKPQLVLLSSTLSDPDCNELAEKIIELVPDIKIAILGASESGDGLYDAMEAGASGYLMKDMKLDDLLKSISLVAKGEVVVSAPLAKKLIDEFGDLRSSSKSGYEENLSERELEILKLLGKGITNREIAETLFITENTAKVHVKNILDKLRLRNRQQAAAYAVQQGLISDIRGSAEV
ncbi:MAG: response regulator transcription factor [Dehalococcoidales bacterium]|nr:response regulator transcription factor [Dehalococcoidales bacterium]